MAVGNLVGSENSAEDGAGNMTQLVITVDTEVRVGDKALDNPDTQIYGQTATGGTYGITYIMDRVSQHGAWCTFFVNVYDTDLWGQETVADVTREISRRSFDLELHTHVEHLDMYGRSSASIVQRGMSECSFERQRGILRDGIARIHKWTGRCPSWHRAGDLYVNLQTLRACGEAGLYGDSSFLFGWSQCMGLGIGPAQRNLPHLFGEVLELPVTTFQALPLLHYFRHFSLDACTLNELIAVTKEAIRGKLKYLVLLMHSFSLVKKIGGGYVCHEENCEKLDGFLDFASRVEGLEITPICDLQKRGLEIVCSEEKTLTRDLYTGFLLTYERAWRHWHRGMKNKVFALVPILACLAALGLVWATGFLR